jgi:hypothetical protein
MRYLIVSQKDRKIEQILYDHNTENMGMRISDEKKSNRESN